MTVAEALSSTSPEMKISIAYIVDNWREINMDDEVDEEYSYEGPAGAFAETMSGYLWLLDEEVKQVATGRYEIHHWAHT